VCCALLDRSSTKATLNGITLKHCHFLQGTQNGVWRSLLALWSVDLPINLPIIGPRRNSHLYQHAQIAYQGDRIRLLLKFRSLKGAIAFLEHLKNIRISLRTCGMAAENGAFVGCFRRPFHRTQHVHVQAISILFSQRTYFGSSTSDPEMDFSRSLVGHGSRYM
jgi:hypothetical protein